MRGFLPVAMRSVGHVTARLPQLTSHRLVLLQLPRLPFCVLGLALGVPYALLMLQAGSPHFPGFYFDANELALMLGGQTAGYLALVFLVWLGARVRASRRRLIHGLSCGAFGCLASVQIMSIWLTINTLWFLGDAVEPPQWHMRTSIAVVLKMATAVGLAIAIWTRRLGARAWGDWAFVNLFMLTAVGVAGPLAIELSGVLPETGYLIGSTGALRASAAGLALLPWAIVSASGALRNCRSRYWVLSRGARLDSPSYDPRDSIDAARKGVAITISLALIALTVASNTGAWKLRAIGEARRHAAQYVLATNEEWMRERMARIGLLGTKNVGGPSDVWTPLNDVDSNPTKLPPELASMRMSIRVSSREPPPTDDNRASRYYFDVLLDAMVVDPPRRWSTVTNICMHATTSVSGQRQSTSFRFFVLPERPTAPWRNPRYEEPIASWARESAQVLAADAARLGAKIADDGPMKSYASAEKSISGSGVKIPVLDVEVGVSLAPWALALACALVAFSVSRSLSVAASVGERHGKTPWLVLDPEGIVQQGVAMFATVLVVASPLVAASVLWADVLGRRLSAAGAGSAQHGLVIVAGAGFVALLALLASKACLVGICRLRAPADPTIAAPPPGPERQVDVHPDDGSTIDEAASE